MSLSPCVVTLDNLNEFPLSLSSHVQATLTQRTPFSILLVLQSLVQPDLAQYWSQSEMF